VGGSSVGVVLGGIGASLDRAAGVVGEQVAGLERGAAGDEGKEREELKELHEGFPGEKLTAR
jgi:hypothetical protein